jgi:hypothetical protein
VEATFSIGIVSCGFLTLIPLLASGMHTARLARNDRITGQIAQTLIEQAKLNVLVPGTQFADNQGEVCSASGAAFTIQATEQTLSSSQSLSPTELTITVTPIGAPDHARTYAVVLPVQQ